MAGLVSLPLYNLCAGAGVALAALLYHHRLGSYLEDAASRARAMVLLLGALPSAVVGAVVFDRVMGVSAGPWLPVRGLAFYGGLLGALTVGALGAAVLRLPLLRVLDAAAPAVALGHAIGRIGCGLGGCCYGRRVEGGVWQALGLERIPTPWIESLGLALLAWGLVRLRPRRPGDVILAYLSGYALLRFAIEPLRGDVRGAMPGVSHLISPAQWVALASAACVAGAIAARRRGVVAVAS